jgi:glutamyl-tRNA(Gln) amidotransferase subunit E
VTKTYFKRVAAPPAPIDLNPRSEPALDFPYREFGTMTPADYERIGFICGLEVHQQLDTKRKLFCRCPAGMNTREVDAEVLRHMRPTLSELGQYDGCALMEFKTNKDIIYQLARSCVCTYELDDTPPFPINETAVKIAIEISRMFDMAVVSELQVMRKQYLDGSIPTGFQRTGLIAVGGELPFPESELGDDRVIRLRQLTIEEDSCREVSDHGHKIVFRTDRLGVPLIETVTEPDMKTPDDVEAGARLIASVARASGKVRRGAGAARQDVNVSVAGSRRIEIKGVPQHKTLPRLVHIEAFRQLELLKIRQELLSRGATVETYDLEDEATPWNSSLVALAEDAVRPSSYPPVQDALEHGATIAAVRLPHFHGLLAQRTQPGITFAQEFSERLRVIACLTSSPCMAHSDDRSAVTGDVWERVRALLGGDQHDTFVIVWGPEEDVATACREVLLRAQDAVIGVPSETRQAHGDGTTGLERILPGPERMYPDTDTPRVTIHDEWVDEVALRENPWVRAARFEAAGLTAAAARRLAHADWADLFDAVAPADAVSAARLAHALEKRVPHLRRTGELEELPDPGRVAELVRDVESGAIRPEAMEAAFDELVRDIERDAELVLAPYRAGADDDDLLAERLEVVRGLQRRDGQEDAAFERRALGEVMPYLLGRMSPADVRTAIAGTLGGDA